MKHSLTLNLYNLVLTFYVCLKQLTDLSLEKIAPERRMLSVVSNSFLFIKQCEITDWRQFSHTLQDLYELKLNALCIKIIRQIKTPLKRFSMLGLLFCSHTKFPMIQAPMCHYLKYCQGLLSCLLSLWLLYSLYLNLLN